MHPTKSLHCTCDHCRGGIEYPAELVGTSIACPHCGQSTELVLATPVADSAVPRRIIVWTIVTVLVLALGLVGALVALKRAKDMAERRKKALQGVAPSGGFPVVFVASTNDFYVSYVTIGRDPRGPMAQAVGVVSNGLGRMRLGVRLELDLLDGAGRRCGSSMDSAPLVEANGQWHFRAPVLVTNAVAAKFASITEQIR